MIEKVEHGFAQFELNESAQALYEFTWLELCDWYIEFSKLPLREGGKARLNTLYTLHYALETLFRAMHPITPFVTESFGNLFLGRRRQILRRVNAMESPKS